jgi:excisionase family DNA binding protein
MPKDRTEAEDQRPVPSLPYGKGARMLTLDELCEWLNITKRHARKLVERDAIPYRKVGRLLRFPEAEVDEWCRPAARSVPAQVPHRRQPREPAVRRGRSSLTLPKSLIE